MAQISIYDLMTQVRLKLGDPRAGKPSDALLLQQVCSQVRNLLRFKHNTGNPWNYSDTIVDVFPDESTYQINVPNFGTPLGVLTFDPQNQNHITRIIPFSSPANIFYNYGYPANFGAWLVSPDGSNNTALRCAFSWSNNIPYIEFLPLPKLPCSYQVRYLLSASGVDDMALSESPLTEEDCDLVIIRSAKHLLANAEWEAGDSAERRQVNTEKRQEMRVSLMDEEILAKEQFDAAQLIVESGRVHTRIDMTSI